MKSSLSSHFITIIAPKSQPKQGFTLIELLVTVIIVGVLAALSLPNLLSQIGKARDTELRSTVGTINRAQQAYHFENQFFTNDIANLGVTVTQQYQLMPLVDTTDPTAFSTVRTNSPSTYQTNGTKAYAGRIEYSNITADYSVILCGSNSPSPTINPPPANTNECPTGSGEVR